MSYEGQVATIPLGLAGLHTDDPQNRISPVELIRVLNCSIRDGLIEKEPGSIRYNQTVLGTGIVSLSDWWPTSITQRVICVGRDGKVYRFVSGFVPATEVTPAGSAPATLVANTQTKIVPCGTEVSGNNRKLFILTGQNPIQVISGDGTTRSNISSPAADWTGSNQPFFAINHRGRVFAFGNANDGHRVYISSATNHEDFLSGASFTSQVYPGDGERLIGGFQYKGKLFVAKYPEGLYILVDDDVSTANWYFAKLTTAFGGASPNSYVGVMDDVLMANAEGSVTSIAAVQAFGDVKSGDVLNILRCEKFMREETSPNGLLERQCVYYPDKKMAMFAYRAAGGVNNQRTLNIDFSLNNKPRVTWSDKDQINHLALIKGIDNVRRPMYGAEDGYIYLMDQADRVVGSTGYTGEFWTPHWDLTTEDPHASETQKNFDFIELVYIPTGDWDLTMEVYIDGVFSKTLTFNLARIAELDQFQLDQDRLESDVPISVRLPIGGQGRRIGFRCYNSGVGQNFKCNMIRVYFRVSDQRQKGK